MIRFKTLPFAVVFLAAALVLITSGCGTTAGANAGSSSNSGTTGSNSGLLTISNVTATNISNSSATVSWTTNQPATSEVHFGPTALYGSATTTDPTLLTSHSQTVSGLITGTNYHFNVQSQNASGELLTSGDYNFTTGTTTTPSNTGLQISQVAFSNLGSSSITITWHTNLAASSQIEYGVTTAYGSFSPLNSAQVTNHSQALSNLTPATTYHFRVHSQTSSGAAVSGDSVFQTFATSGGGNSNFPGLPSGIGWHSLGESSYTAGPFLDTALTKSPPDPANGSYPGNANQCPADGWQGATLAVLPSTDPRYYRFGGCGAIVAAQSSGVADTFRNQFILMGGGHGDRSGNDLYGLDLTANPVTLRRIKDPAFPVVNDLANPDENTIANFNIAAIPENSAVNTYAIQSISGNGSTVTVTFASPTAFCTRNINGAGKGYIKISGTGTFDGGPFALKTATPSCGSATQVTYAATTVGSAGGGNASTTWSACVPDSSGLGCSPNAVHTTDELVYVVGSNGSGTVDHSKDGMLLMSGSSAPNGNGVGSTWFLPFGGGISKTGNTQWIWKDQIAGAPSTAGVAPGNGFGTAEYDPSSKLVFVSNPSYGTGYAPQSSLLAYDAFGEQGAHVPNQWYVASTNFVTNNKLSGTVWKNLGGDGKVWYFAVGGCTAMPISTISRAGGVATAILTNNLPNVPLVQGSRIWIYGVADASFNVGDGTNGYTTVSNSPVSGANSSVQFPTANTSSASSSGGVIYSCDGGASYHNANGVLAADVSSMSTVLSGGVTQQVWNNNTFAHNNLDLGDSSLGNTCAEALSGGIQPLQGNGGYGGGGGPSPGVAVDTSTGNPTSNTIVFYPNEGNYVYFVRPDPGNMRWTCERSPNYLAFDSAAAPQNTAVNGLNTTWGEFKRFAYFPGPDVFLLIQAADQPARILRIR